MKKLVTLLICLIILGNSTFTIHAENNTVYVPSIGYKDDIFVPDDDIEGGTVVYDEEDGVYIIKRKESDGCDVEIVVTPYAKKTTIESNESRLEIDIAYDEVMKTKSVCTMAPVMIKWIEGTNLVDEDLVLSNIFDVTVYVHEAGTHKVDYDHSRLYNIKVGAETLRNFVALLHYNYDPVSETGEWEIVPDARVTGVNKDIVTFSWVDGSPFAIVSYIDKDTSHYDTVNTQTGVVFEHRCLVDIGGVCYCWLVVLLLVISVFFNIYLVLRKHEKR